MTDPTDNSGRRERSGRGTRPPRASAARPSTADDATAAASTDESRIAKVMARAGLCSRRDAEAWILAGRVAVNGKPIDSPALNIGPDDTITVDGHTIEKAEKTRLFMFHKPRGLVTTAKDPEGRPTIFTALPEDLPRLVTVGRLDINTEGLLLLTNDGGLSRMLELPSTGWVRRYRVRANGSVDQPTLDRLAEGITVDGVDYAGIEAKLDRQQGANVWLTMGLREGKNREIKRVLEHLGLAVSRLIRLSYGPFQLGDLPEGAVEEVRTRVLRDQLGEALAREAGVDFDGPVTAAVVTRDVRQARRTEQRQKHERTGPRAAPETAAAPTTRPHVSALRADRAEAMDGPRRRTERGATADRKGRAVAVERVTAVGQKPRYPTTRNARRFDDLAREASGQEARRRPPRAAEGAATGPAPANGARPTGKPRTLRQADRPERQSRAAAAGPTDEPRVARPRSGVASPGGDKPRFRGRDGAGTRQGAAGPEGAGRPRPARRDGPASDGPRAPRGKGAGPGGGGRFGGERPDGDRPRGNRSGDGRPGGNRPGGKPPGGNRPGGGGGAGRRPSR